MGALRVVALLAAVAPVALTSPSAADPQVEAAIQALRRDSSLKVRTQAAIVLGQRSAAEAVPALRRAVSDDGAAAVRIAAVTALAKIGDRRARPTLRHASAADPDVAVRSAAARALASFGPPTLAIDEPAGPASLRSAFSGARARELNVRGFAVSDPAEIRLRPTVEVRLDAAAGRKTVVSVRTTLAVVDGDGRVDLLEAAARATVSGSVPDGKLAGVSARAVEAAARALCDDVVAKLGDR